MANLNKWVRSVALVGAASLSLAACGGGGGSSSTTSSAPASSAATSSAASGPQAGGTLYFFQHYAFASTDPTRIYYGIELANFRRLFYRSLLAFPTSTDPKVGTTPVPDLATDTGTTPDNGQTWSFTIKDGVKWQDGSPITCEDFKYGASRVFAQDVLTGGPNYLISYLDIPKNKDGSPAYDGPYKGDGQALYDKAVTCDGQTITYHFNKPWPDFPLAVAELMTTDPYKQSFDKGDKSKNTVMSNGPYMIDGSYNWNHDQGASLVRNPNYDPSTDDPSIRAAYPDKIEYQISTAGGATLVDQIIADSGPAKCAVTSARISPAQYPQVAQPPVSSRTVDVVSPDTYYLLPNFDRLTNPLVRQALAWATNKTGFIKALGGDKAASPADSIVNPLAGGYVPNPFFSQIPPEGDTTKAAALLAQAGVQTPYPITFTYSSDGSGGAVDKAAAALRETWDAAGFDTTLDPQSTDYYTYIAKKNKPSDVVWAGWGADWPSAMTVLPPLFDSRPNISGNNLGQDNGDYVSKDFEALVDQASSASSIDQQNQFLQQADALLGTDVAYIPLLNSNFYWIWGSGIVNFTTTPASSSYAELGDIAVDPSVCS